MVFTEPLYREIKHLVAGWRHGCILDEIQYSPELLHYIKDDIDSRRQPGRWLLTGSQDFALMRG